MDWVPIGALIVAIAIPVILGFAGTALNAGPNSDWYRFLDKPSWTPADWVFPIMWTILYILMGVASWLVWKKGGFHAQGVALGFYIAQLVVSFLWTQIFFGLRHIGLALLDIVLLWILILVTIILFWNVDRAAGYLLLPYIIWVTLAASINLYVWIKNPNAGQHGYSDITRPLSQGQVSA